jgi:hypothetical protein
MSRKKQHPKKRAEWQPLVRSTPHHSPQARARVIQALLDMGMDRTGALDFLDKRDAAELWASDLYVVLVDRDIDGNVERLSIRRQDRRPVRDWRDMQRIKNQIAGPEVEAVELFPPQSRLVDSANQYWLWCLPPGATLGFGFEDRLVSGSADAAEFHAVQRDFYVDDPLLVDLSHVPPLADGDTLTITTTETIGNAGSDER